MLVLWLKDIGAGAALVLFIGTVFWLATVVAPAIASALNTLVFGG